VKISQTAAELLWFLNLTTVRHFGFLGKSFSTLGTSGTPIRVCDKTCSPSWILSKVIFHAEISSGQMIGNYWHQPVVQLATRSAPERGRHYYDDQIRWWPRWVELQLLLRQSRVALHRPSSSTGEISDDAWLGERSSSSVPRSAKETWCYIASCELRHDQAEMIYFTDCSDLAVAFQRQ